SFRPDARRAARRPVPPARTAGAESRRPCASHVATSLSSRCGQSAEAFALRRHFSRRKLPWRGALGVDELRTVDGVFLAVAEQPIDALDPLREAVILVRHLVLPRAEPASAADVARLENRLDRREPAVAMERRCRIAALEAPVPPVVHLIAPLDQS